LGRSATKKEVKWAVASGRSRASWCCELVSVIFRGGLGVSVYELKLWFLKGRNRR